MLTIPKHKEVARQIIKAIRGGEFDPATRLPGEKELANRYDVSFMTARRTVSSLVESGILERRGNSGTYIRSEAVERLSSKILHFLLPSYDSPTNMELIDHVQNEIDRRAGWRLEVTRIHPHRLSQTESILLSGEPCLLFGDIEDLKGRLGTIIQKPECKVVCLGNIPVGMVVPAVFTDDISRMRIALDYLWKAGHRKIGVLNDIPFLEANQRKMEIWKSRVCNTGGYDPALLAIETPTPPYKYPADYVYPQVKQWLEKKCNGATALIALSEEVVVGIMAAAADTRVRVGEDLSLVCCGSSRLLRYLRPVITYVDSKLKEHVLRAMEVLDKILSNELTQSDYVNVIQHDLVEGDSVKRIH